MSPNATDSGATMPAVRDPEASYAPIEDLPKEIGVLLLTLGFLGLLLPGPWGTPALIAGGVVLWPGTFGRLSRWMERRYPHFMHESNHLIHRYLDDLERRYPGS